MASNCKACSDLREYAPEFVTNGVTDNVFLNLENDNGLGNNEDHTDCDDLVDAVDCLVGNMDDEIEAYEICSWKDYMHKLVPNLHQTIKAVIGAICGLWNNVCRLWCYVNFLLNGVEIDISEKYKETDKTRVVAGRGVSFLYRSAESHTGSDVKVRSYGNMLRISGSFTFFTGGTKWSDADAVGNYDDNSTLHWSVQRYARRDSSSDAYNSHKEISGKGYLVCEIQIWKEDYPFIKRIRQGFGKGSIANIDIDYITEWFDEGQDAYGNYPDDPTHKVEDGYMYLQLRVKSWEGGESDIKMGSPAGTGPDIGGEPRSAIVLACLDVDQEEGLCGDLGNYENCENDLHQEVEAE